MFPLVELEVHLELNQRNACLYCAAWVGIRPGIPGCEFYHSFLH